GQSRSPEAWRRSREWPAYRAGRCHPQYPPPRLVRTALSSLQHRRRSLALPRSAPDPEDLGPALVAVHPSPLPPLCSLGTNLLKPIVDKAQAARGGPGHVRLGRIVRYCLPDLGSGEGQERGRKWFAV